MRMQQAQQVAQQRSAQQEALYAGRLARADAKRAKRGERIAVLKVRRAFSSSESTFMLTSRLEARDSEIIYPANLQ